VFYFVLRRSWRLRPWRTRGFVWCIVLAGTSERLVGPRVLEGARCRCCSIEWSFWIDYSRNPS